MRSESYVCHKERAQSEGELSFLSLVSVATRFKYKYMLITTQCKKIKTQDEN